MFLALVELLSLVLFRAPALSLCKRVAVPFTVDVIIAIEFRVFVYWKVYNGAITIVHDTGDFSLFGQV